MGSTSPSGGKLDRSAGLVLILFIFVLAICGLVYELIAGTLSSYLLGDSVTQFSLVIGLFLTAMGLGSYLSKFITRNLLARLIGMEIAVGLVGGMMALIGFATFSLSSYYVPVLLVMIGLIGTLVGLEVPLMVRILREISSLPITLANVLSADYVGALVASIVFPFLLLPQFGVVRAGLLMGVVNVVVAGVVLWRLAPFCGRASRRLKIGCALALTILILSFGLSGKLVALLENKLYEDEVIYACDTQYQHLVLTRWREDIRLFLDGHLQFSSIDEYRYHEALVHPAMISARRRNTVLILGGGDGLAAREVAKYPQVERIDIVDIDPVITNLFRNNVTLSKLNHGILSDSRVQIHNIDAMKFLKDTAGLYDVILIDLPDPSGVNIAKLYSRTFFSLVGRHLADGGRLACQSTSPFRSREAFWCIVHTMEAARWGAEGLRHRLAVHPYHTVVPTFGTWGFVVAGEDLLEAPQAPLTVPTRYLTQEILSGLFVFPPDMTEVKTPVSRLDDPVVSHLYRRGYHQYLE